MRVSFIFQLVCAVLVMAALAMALVFAKSVKSKARTLAQAPEALYEELASSTSQGNLLASQAMIQARQSIGKGEYSKAHDKLRFLINFYSEASFASEAKKILGTLNLDQIMSPSNPKYKKNYTVQRGDSLSRVASKHDSTVENVMEMNGLLYPNRLQPEEELVCMELNFRTVIDVSKKTIGLYDQERFIKEYPLLEVSYTSKSKLITTNIDRSMAFDGGTLVPRISSKYRVNKKLLILKAGNLQIRPVKHPDEPDPGKGFFLSASDMEEYNLLVRDGNVVEIKQ